MLVPHQHSLLGAYRVCGAEDMGSFEVMCTNECTKGIMCHDVETDPLSPSITCSKHISVLDP